MGTPPRLSARTTYWHLEGRGAPPSDYEVVTSRLLYYPGRGFEVSTPLSGWYAEHQRGSLLRCPDGDAFRDPRETTYASYVARMCAQEARVDALLAEADRAGYDRKLSRPWLKLLSRVLSPVRYPLHGLQRLACYVGHMAPSGRVVVAGALQAADEIRRIQHIAYRTRQLEEVEPGFASDAARSWQHEPAWQPLRELIERMLVTYDWGEALVALNLVLKPMFDDWLMGRLGRAARAADDSVLAGVLAALHEDCAWHRAWAEALVTTLVSQAPENLTVVSRWLEAWRPRARAALAPLEALIGEPEGKVRA